MNDTATAMSRQILLRLLIAVLLLAGIAAFNSTFLYRLYFSEQLTVVGWIVSGNQHSTLTISFDDECERQTPESGHQYSAQLCLNCR